MKFTGSRLMLGVAAAAWMLVLIGCSSGSSTTVLPNQPQNGTVNVLVSDDPTEDWATIGVKVLSITLTPQGGGTPVPIFTAGNPAPTINLLQLDQLNEILGSPSIQAGTYAAAVITISGNPGDVMLTASADPETGFAAAAGSTIPSNQIQILGTQGSAGSLTVPVKLTLDTPLTVTSGQSTTLNLDFDLAHPAFIVAHVPPANAGTTMWAVNFNGPIRHRHVDHLDRLILRHHYGTVTQVSTDNSTLTFDKDYPVYPPTNPETEITSSNTLNVEADSANGTLYYDLDEHTSSTIKDFSSIASTIVGKYIRVAARYQVDGTLVAVRLWASSSFNAVWISPEGHVLHVDAVNATIVVENELGIGVPVQVDNNTLFYFRTPANAQSDANSIGQGPTFLSNLVRGFKVHVGSLNPLGVPLVASTIDIEIARFDGTISNSNMSNFTYTRNFHTASDDYTVTLPYIPSGSTNTDDQSSASVSGFEWWNFAFPTVVDNGSTAVSDFVSATNFGGNVGLNVVGETYATWNDAVAASSWTAPSAVLDPTAVPLTPAATGYSSANSNFTIVLNGTQSVPVDLNATPGSATLVYQVDWSGGVFTISPVDITTSAGQNTLTTNLVPNTPVKVYGIPQADGSIKCYVLSYFTGFAQATTD